MCMLLSDMSTACKNLFGWFVYTGPLQTQFGHVTQHGYAGYPSVPMFPQQGIPLQPISGQQYDPQTLQFNNRPANNVYAGYPLSAMHPHQSAPTQYPHFDGQNYHTDTTATAPLGNSGVYNLETANQAPNRNQQSESMVLHALLNRLADDHHSILLKQLTKHASVWREIGTYLGFAQGELNNIQANQFLAVNSPVSWLSAMLSQWLQWAPGDSRGSNSFATLEDLKSALSQARLGATAHDLKV